MKIIVKIFQFYLLRQHIHYWCKRKFTAKEALNRFKMEAASD